MASLFQYMGLFSGSTKTYIFANSVDLMGEPPESTKMAVTKAIVGNEDLTTELINMSLNGPAARFRTAFNYAKKHYTYGLPSGKSEYLAVNRDAVKAAIELEVGGPVIMEGAYLGKLSPVSLAINWALEHLELDTADLSMPGKFFIDPELDDQPVHFIGAESNGGTQITLYGNFTYSVTDCDGYGKDRSCTTTEYTREVAKTINIVHEPESLQYQAWYQRLNASGGLIKESEQLWSYTPGTGTYPELDVIPSSSHAGSYYPIVPLRRDNKDYTSGSRRNTELFITSRRLLNRLGLDIDDVASVVNSNPDVGEIDHAYLYCGVTLKSDTPAAHKYLAEYFAYLHAQDKVSGVAHTSADVAHGGFLSLFLGGAMDVSGGRRVRIQDAGLKLELAYSSIDVRLERGKIGSVGHATRAHKNWIVDGGTYTRCSSRRNGEHCTTRTRRYKYQSLTYKVQVSPNVIKKVVVVNPTHINYVYGSRSIETYADQAINEGDDNFIIPLHSHIVDQMTTQDKNKLYYDSLHLVFNSIKQVKSKWYQSGFFKFVMVAVAIVAAAMGAPQLSAAIAGAWAAGAYAFAMFILKAVLVAVITRYTFKLVAQVLGPVAAMILAVVTIAVSFGVGNMTTSLGPLGNVPTAQLMLGAGNGLMTASQNMISEEMKGIMGDKEAFDKEVETKTDLLEEAQKLLDTSDLIDPFEFIQIKPMIFPHETPEEYYFRVSHMGNIGTEVLNSARNYVDRQLILPETNPFKINEVLP